MKPAPFTLITPKTVDEAIQLLAEKADEDGLIIAGGQSLVPMMALRVAYPSVLIDINHIPELSQIEVRDGVVHIGSTVRHAAFHSPAAVPGVLGSILSGVSHHIAHYPIRQRGTFCGSIAHADPSSEWCLVSATLGASIKLVSSQRARTIEPEEYFEAAMMTAREPEEMITHVVLPLLSENTCWGFYEFNRRAGDFALGMALVVYELEDGLIVNPRVGIGGIEDTPRRLNKAEVALEGEIPGPETFSRAVATVSSEVDPMHDATTSAEYRRDLSATVVSRALDASVTTSEAFGN